MTTLTLPDTPLTRPELAELGLDREAVRRLVEAGVLRRVVRGVVVRADIEVTPELLRAAVAKAIAPDHVLVDRTAAMIHDVDAYSLAERAIGPKVEACVLRGHHPTSHSAADGRTRDLIPEDVMRIDGLRVTTPLRTALDLGRNLRRREAFGALVGFTRKHGITRELLATQLPRFRRHRGVVQLRELVPLVDERLESEREAWVWLQLHDEGVPLPEPQHWILVDGVPTYRLDFAWPAHRTCLEYDGVEAHLKSPEQIAHDDARRAWLREQGWTVVVVRNGDFTGAALDGWLRELRAALAPRYVTRRW